MLLFCYYSLSHMVHLNSVSHKLQGTSGALTVWAFYQQVAPLSSLCPHWKGQSYRVIQRFLYKLRPGVERLVSSCCRGLNISHHSKVQPLKPVAVPEATELSPAPAPVHQRCSPAASSLGFVYSLTSDCAFASCMRVKMVDLDPTSDKTVCNFCWSPAEARSWFKLSEKCIWRKLKDNLSIS